MFHLSFIIIYMHTYHLFDGTYLRLSDFFASNPGLRYFTHEHHLKTILCDLLGDTYSCRICSFLFVDTLIASSFSVLAKKRFLFFRKWLQWAVCIICIGT